MSDDYRSELGAAQARIAQLEEQLLEARGEARGDGSPELAAEEARHARLANDGPRRGMFAAVIMSVLLAVMIAPVVVIEATYEGAAAAVITTLLGIAFTAGSALGMRWLVKKQHLAYVDQSAKKLAEARRLNRLERDMRALREAAPQVRVAAPPEAAEAPEELDAPSEPAKNRR
jgi:hypothetical protein